ncbi:UDP-N-acetylmuramate dehydrogenase [bacterium]|nr:UDP-N-acetylmuramate dehydrogenase [bacterium]
MINKLNFQRNVLLSRYTSFRIGGPAKYFFVAESSSQLRKAIEFAHKNNLKFFILGGGSNLLVSDKGFDGLVIKIEISGIIFKNRIVQVFSGEKLSNVINYLAKNNLSGLEWAVGIPGTIGGAIYGNVGAFSHSISELVKDVKVIDLGSRRELIYKNRDCRFIYRGSIFKKDRNLIIISANLKFKKAKKDYVKRLMQKYLSQKRKNQPLEFYSAGCIFKNFFIDNDFKKVKGIKEVERFKKCGSIPSAYLIEKCGLKGAKVGGAMISKKHSNFIINLGNAKAKDVIALINLIKKEIMKKFNIKLEEEIEYLGF